MRIPEIKEEMDFSEYVWMGEELEEFDRKVVAELEEQYEMEEEFEKFLEQQVVYYIDFALDDDGIPLAQASNFFYSRIIFLKKNMKKKNTNIYNVK